LNALRDSLRRINGATEQIIDAVRASIYQEAQGIIAKSVRNTPVDTGRLRASAFATLPEEKEIESTIGHSVEYALYVHERTEMRFVTGGAKFLERAVNERRQGYEERLAKRIDENFRLGRKLGTVKQDFPTTVEAAQEKAERIKKKPRKR